MRHLISPQRRAFQYAVVRDRVDQLIKAGTYTMGAGITPAGIASRLAAAPDPPTPVVTYLPERRGLFGQRLVYFG